MAARCRGVVRGIVRGTCWRPVVTSACFNRRMQGLGLCMISGVFADGGRDGLDCRAVL